MTEERALTGTLASRQAALLCDGEDASFCLAQLNHNAMNETSLLNTLQHYVQQ